ncbi:MAG: DUF4198 domain-containing protein [Gemmatimonadota bacterium]
MRRSVPLAGALVLLAAAALWAHDMFLKLETFFLAPHAEATVTLINGTFDESLNAISRDRMTDVSIVGPDHEVVHPPPSAWHDADSAAHLTFETGDAGTYVIGVSTAPRIFELSGAEFDAYLEHDGVLDILEKRESDGTLGRPAVERYSKHVKAIVQVGERHSAAYAHRLGYPVELIPLQNPYDLDDGDTLDVLFLIRGAPGANQLVYASHEGYHGHDAGGGHVEAVRSRTDGDGVARIPLSAEGRWYVRLIHMVETEEEAVDYESSWATLTFEIE